MKFHAMNNNYFNILKFMYYIVVIRYILHHLKFQVFPSSWKYRGGVNMLPIPKIDLSFSHKNRRNRNTFFKLLVV